MPTRISEMPITRMMVPVTTGGNSGNSRLMKGAASMPNIPAATLPAGPLALIVENIFRAPSLEHGIGLYYRITWPSTLAPDDLLGGTEEGHHFRWVPVRDLGSVDFRPAGLIPILPGLDGALRHVVLTAL